MPAFLDLLACKSLQGLSFFFQWLPLEKALAAGRGIGSLAFWFSSRRRVAYADIKAAFGGRFTEKERRQLVCEHYQHLGQMFAELLRFPKLDRETIEKTMKVHYLEGYFDVFQENKGGFF